MKRLLTLTLASITVAGQAFVLNTDGAGHFLHWNLFSSTSGVSTNVINLNTHSVRYFLASDAYFNPAAELNAVRGCFAQWMAGSNSYIKFEEGGLVAPPVDVNSGDNRNVVYWTKTSTLVNGGMDNISGALGVTFNTWQSSDMSLKHSDIVFNGVQFNWFTDPSDPTTTVQFVDGVALHEIGHFVGLSHSPVGGATMFWRGGGGVNPQTGLHADDFSGLRFLYPTNAVNYGALKGTVLKDGLPVLGATVTAYDSVTNAAASTLTLSDGSYQLQRLPPGAYRLRVTPLDNISFATRLCSGFDVSDEYTGADTNFLPTATSAATVTTGTTNTLDFTVTDGAPAFRISRIVRPTTTLASFSYSGVPIQLRAGQSNYYVGVASADLPTNNATFTVSGNGLTFGPLTYFTTSGFNFIFMPLKISSNATPGLRDFMVATGAATNYAPGYLTILPTVTDDNFDGLDDSFQRYYFAPFTATNAAPTADPDGDMFNNQAEYVSGTVPTNGASFLKVESVTTTAGGSTVRWLGSIGRRYQVSSRTNLTTAAWQDIGPVLTTTNYFDNTATNGTRFYRVRALP